MSLTIPGNTAMITSAGPTTARADHLRHPMIAPDAVRSLITSTAVTISFRSITCVYCLTYRIRKAKMRRVVVAAFEQVSSRVINGNLR